MWVHILTFLLSKPLALANCSCPGILIHQPIPILFEHPCEQLLITRQAGSAQQTTRIMILSKVVLDGACGGGEGASLL